MLRRIIVPFVAFVLPFLLFALYRALRDRRVGPKTLENWPLAVLFIAGAVLAVQTFALAALTEPRTTVRPPERPIEDARP